MYMEERSWESKIFETKLLNEVLRIIEKNYFEKT